MHITAHSGSCNTKANSIDFFERIEKYPINAIEVDIRCFSNFLFLSHNPTIFLKNKVPLDYLFNYIKNKNFKVNCDLKQFNILPFVEKKAKEYDVIKKLFFTGNLSVADTKKLESECYLNCKYMKRAGIDFKDPKTVKEAIEKMKNDRILGLNVSYEICNENFLKTAADNNLKLSVYTVDDVKVFERLADKSIVSNITTNLSEDILKCLGWF